MTTTAKHLLSEIVAGLDGADKSLLASKGVTVSEENIRSITAYVEQIEKENRVLHELRRDLLTLQKRIIGETGLSAIETIDRALKVFDAAHLYEIFDEDRAALGGSNE